MWNLPNYRMDKQRNKTGKILFRSRFISNSTHYVCGIRNEVTLLWSQLFNGFVGNELETNVGSCYGAFNKYSSLMNLKEKCSEHFRYFFFANACVSSASLQKIFVVVNVFISLTCHVFNDQLLIFSQSFFFFQDNFLFMIIFDFFFFK